MSLNIDCLMIVCICRAVNEDRIREAVQTGATVDDLKRELGITSVCGRCTSCVHRLVEDLCHRGSSAAVAS